MSSPTAAGVHDRHPPGPLHATLLAGSVPLFLGALLSDVAYYQTYQIQWSNFASWLIAGAELFGDWLAGVIAESLQAAAPATRSTAK